MTGVSTSCGACKFLRRRCMSECIFAPYFSYEQAASHFEAVHKVFGASNVSKLLSHLPVPSRSDAAITVSYEALARMQDPVYGCVAHIIALQQQVASLEEEIQTVGNQIANSAVETSKLYHAAQSDMITNCSEQQVLPTLHSDHIQVNGACPVQQLTTEGISQEYLNSGLFEKLLEELNQDYYLHEQFTQDYYLQSMWRSMPQFHGDDNNVHLMMM